MFGIDFPEFIVIAVVALVVLGPERLPKAARFAGLWVRRARAQWASVKNELERELAADELKQSLHDSAAALRDIDASVRAADADARREFDAMRKATTASAPIAMTPTDHRDGPATPAPVMTAIAPHAAPTKIDGADAGANVDADAGEDDARRA